MEIDAVKRGPITAEEKACRKKRVSVTIVQESIMLLTVLTCLQRLKQISKPIVMLN